LEHADRNGRGVTYYTGIYLTGLKKVMATLGQGIRCPDQNSRHALHEHMLKDLPFETKSLVARRFYKMAESDN
jgi:hypothetical protein